MKLLLLAMLAAFSCAAQTFNLGSSSDLCDSGSLPWGAPPLRYGITFSCTFPAPAGLYTVTLAFQEPGQTAVGSRIFSVSVNGYSPATLKRIDLAAAGASNSGMVISRSVPAISTDGKIKVAFTTQTRSAVLSAVTLTPASVPGSIVRKQCIGSVGTSDCKGIELWTITDGGVIRQYAAVPAMFQLSSLPGCPSATAFCLQPAAIGDPPLAMLQEEPGASLLQFAEADFWPAGALLGLTCHGEAGCYHSPR